MQIKHSQDSDPKMLMRNEINRYMSLRRHDESDPIFRQRLEAVQLFQAHRLRSNHHELIQDPLCNSVMDFFINDLYRGVNLSVFSKTGMDVTLKLVTTLLSDPQLMISALELNALGGELDEKTAAMLFEIMGVNAISMENYEEAHIRLDNFAERMRHAELMLDIAYRLEKYAKSRIAYAAFKIARTPCYMGGLNAIYDFLNRGFTLMRSMDSVSDTAELLVRAEIANIRKLYGK